MHDTKCLLRKHSSSLLKLVLNLWNKSYNHSYLDENQTQHDKESRPYGEVSTSDSPGIKQHLELVEVHKSEVEILMPDS